MIITSTTNNKIKELSLLQKKSSFRKEKQLFVVEGSRILAEVPVGYLKALYFSESFYKKQKKWIEEFAVLHSLSPTILSDTIFDTMPCIKKQIN